MIADAFPPSGGRPATNLRKENGNIMMNYEMTVWRADSATHEYLRENQEKLHDPKSMTDQELAEALTYCADTFNPYAEELTLRAGMSQQLANCPAPSLRMKLICEAAAHCGIRIV